MQKSERSLQARRELDRKYARAALEPIRVRPRHGWIRAVRAGLGMSQRALAQRLAVSPAAVAKLERSEVNGTVSIGKLQEIARSLDCTLVYALVPNSTLEETVERRAREVAASRVAYVAHTMALEDQAIDATRREEVVAREARAAIERGRLWTAP